MLLNRRNFVKGVSALSLSAASAEFGCSGTETTPQFRHAKAPDIGYFGRISMNAYCFNSAIDDTTKGRPNKSCVTDLFEALEFAAKYKVDAIDPTGYFWPGFPNPPAKDYLRCFQQKAQDLGIAVSGTGARNDFAQADPAARKHDVGILSSWAEVCAELNAPVLRVFAGPVPLGYEQRWEEVATWMAESLREVTVAARLNGVKLGIQNHGDMLRTSDQMLRLLEMVDSEWLGVINDTGYFSTPDPYVDIERMMPYTVSIQVKESVRPVKRQHPYYMDLPRLMRIVHDSGYQGFLPIETLPTVDEHSGTGELDYNPGMAVPAFLKKLRAAINQTTGQPVADTPDGIICTPGMAIDGVPPSTTCPYPAATP